MSAWHFLSLSGPQSRRVLCADDHEQITLLMKRLLERAGHIVECVSNGQQAWERITAEPDAFDVIVTDHQMPQVSGLELAAKLRAIGFAGKIIIQSCRLTTDEENAFRALAVDRILCKPGDVLRLADVVREA
jgi:CheY-like chemotaxis protein